MQPIRFTISVDFSDEEAAGVGGRSTVRTAMLDALFSALKITTDGICNNLALIQRDDGRLLDGTVRLNALAPSVLAFIATQGGALRGAWATAVGYELRDVVTQGTGTYISAIAHTSGVFATDLAAGKWITISEAVAALVASDIAFTPAGSIGAVDVQAAIVELDAETLKKASNLSDILDMDAARSNLAIEQCIPVAVGDETTPITAGAGKVTFRVPSSCFLNSVRASLATAGSTITTVDINRGGVSLFGTKLSINANERTSATAAAPVTYVNQDLVEDEVLTIDIDIAGTGAAGLKVYLLIRVL